MAVIRRLREIAASLKNTYKTIVIVSPMLEMPPELEKDMTVVDFDLPRATISPPCWTASSRRSRATPSSTSASTARCSEQIVHALLGLTLAEAENVLAKTLVQHRGLGKQSLEVINAEKQQIIRKSGLLEYYDAEETMESVGGLDTLKGWLVKRSVAFTEQARAVRPAGPQGRAAAGRAGLRQEPVAKAISNIWKLPLLRFDVGRVFGSLVGSSEQNIRRAIQVAESVAPVVLWVDEIDKAFRGSRGSGGLDRRRHLRAGLQHVPDLAVREEDAGLRHGHGQRHLRPAARNCCARAASTRSSSWTCPCTPERQDIFRIHLAKRKLDPAKFDLEALATSGGRLQRGRDRGGDHQRAVRRVLRQEPS